MIFILSVYVRQNAIPTKFSFASWVVLTPIEQQIKKKIEDKGTPLKDWDIQINYGIKTGYNDAFIIDGVKRKELIEQDPKSADIIQPILRGRDIRRYSYDFDDRWLINTHNGIKEKGIKPININDYPAIKKHLDQFFPKLERRADKGDTLYNLRNCAYMEDFYKQKVVWKRVGSILRFSYDESSLIALDSTCFATGNYIKYITAYLNSKIGNYLLQDSPQTGTGDLLISVQAIEPILAPLPSERINLEVESIIDQLVNSSVDKKGRDFLEEKINSIIYKQLKLDNEEVKFIDSL